LPLLVPQVDADGNERAGIRLPDVAVPLATLTGWNFRKAEIGAPDQLFPLLGSFIPFAPTRAVRESAGDPRRSIEERYRGREQYLQQVRHRKRAGQGRIARMTLTLPYAGPRVSERFSGPAAITAHRAAEPRKNTAQRNTATEKQLKKNTENTEKFLNPGSVFRGLRILCVLWPGHVKADADHRTIVALFALWLVAGCSGASPSGTPVV
jgi:hypothetical protein